ncbi:hypothetical protein Q1695_012869 [Nippostrongylus brasiliensis]|nr:hypothetical protein Q1695_012869 [Nippostrongylus brasiliensis]
MPFEEENGCQFPHERWTTKWVKRPLDIGLWSKMVPKGDKTKKMDYTAIEGTWWSGSVAEETTDERRCGRV